MQFGHQSIRDSRYYRDRKLLVFIAANLVVVALTWFAIFHGGAPTRLGYLLYLWSVVLISNKDLTVMHYPYWCRYLTATATVSIVFTITFAGFWGCHLLRSKSVVKAFFLFCTLWGVLFSYPVSGFFYYLLEMDENGLLFRRKFQISLDGLVLSVNLILMYWLIWSLFRRKTQPFFVAVAVFLIFQFVSAMVVTYPLTVAP